MNRHASNDDRQKVEAERELLRVRLNVLAASQDRSGFIASGRRTAPLEPDEVPGAFDDNEMAEDG